MPIIERFTGRDRQRITTTALARQKIVQGDQAIAEKIFAVATLREYEANSSLIVQGATDSATFMILAGEVAIIANGREVARRRTNQHVGEMALIDPSQHRSATVVATMETVAAAIEESDFTKIANVHATLWRQLALELADRLRERNKFIKPPNSIPEVFVGSSSEALSVAQEIQIALSRRSFIVTLWTDDFFEPGSTTIDALLNGMNKADFAVLLLGPDDVVTSRETEAQAPRDNVIFELGLAMGALGRQRAFIVHDRNVRIKIPSDLLGITRLDYQAGDASTIAARIAPVATKIAKRIADLGPQ